MALAVHLVSLHPLSHFQSVRRIVFDLVVKGNLYCVALTHDDS